MAPSNTRLILPQVTSKTPCSCPSGCGWLDPSCRPRRAGRDDATGNHRLGAHGIEGDDATTDVQEFEQGGNRRDLVILGLHVHLPQQQPMLAGPSTAPMEGRWFVLAVVGALAGGNGGEGFALAESRVKSKPLAMGSSEVDKLGNAPAYYGLFFLALTLPGSRVRRCVRRHHARRRLLPGRGDHGRG